MVDAVAESKLIGGLAGHVEAVWLVEASFVAVGAGDERNHRCARFVSHYGILIIAAALYYVALVRSRWMRGNVVLCGALFGVCIYAFMHLVVLPLSNAPPFKSSWVGMCSDFAMHVLVIGPAIALSLRKFARLS